jgi:hypothetical protein
MQKTNAESAKGRKRSNAIFSPPFKKIINKKQPSVNQLPHFGKKT